MLKTLVTAAAAACCGLFAFSPTSADAGCGYGGRPVYGGGYYGGGYGPGYGGPVYGGPVYGRPVYGYGGGRGWDRGGWRADDFRRRDRGYGSRGRSFGTRQGVSFYGRGGGISIGW